ncbi:hypothetical protein SD70_26995 [Gordoniibacillus kamchatkensis]|uniref:Uncharacterized protein n=1 Tax=Gordoniibacillus kamchatkensis TaxID=1590651 RepID=A0ABR5ABC6_9BACL|nr:hypothetical protein [Paenibacillus sp. VKM B-2647]KIL38323.1 hypothetical protein SD70_26995 [Paenibacillus sp. VKM B-2647]
MKKEASIAFQINFNDLDEKSSRKINRFFALYRQLKKNRHLARFCKEAFIEKAGRRLDGLEHSYYQLDRLIKSKGIQYILDSVHEKESAILRISATVPEKREEEPRFTAVSTVSAATEEAADEAGDEAPASVKQDDRNPEMKDDHVPSLTDDHDPSIKKVDIEKLRELL